MAKSGKAFFIFILLVQILFSTFSFATKSSDVQVKVNQKQVSVGDVFSVAVVINIVGNYQPTISIHEFPSHPKISFLSESQSFSIQQIVRNGVESVSKTITLNLFFRALAQGQVKVPSIKLKINNKVAVIEKGFQIDIVKSSGKGQGSKQGQNKFDARNQDLLSDVFNNFFRSDSFGVPRGQTGELDFFIDVEVSNMFPYYSEQFVANWYLYTNGRVTDIDTLKYPALQGFWKDEISLATSLAAENVQKNGRNFTRYLLASYALTPIVKDQAIIDPYEVKSQLIGNIFSFGAKELIRVSDEAIIRIKPLPEVQPEDFTGAVGNFSASSYIKDSTFKVGQPFEFFVRVFGQGQLKFMELPDLGLNEDEISVYDTSEESQFKPPLNSVKIYKILLVPQKKGVLTLPELHMSFFDPGKSKFYSVNTRSLNINVEGADEVQQDIVTAYDAKLKGRFQPSPYTHFSENSPSFGSMSGPQSFFIVIFSLLISISLLVYKFFSLQVKYDFNKDLADRFNKLMSLIQNDEWREASKMAVNIVYFYANAKTKNRPKSQKLEDILDVLPVGLRRSIELTITTLNEDLQKFSFAPKELIQSTQAKGNVLEKCLALKALLERSSNDETEST